MPSDDCLFCRIVAMEIPADIVYEDDVVMAFRDITPKAPVHILLIPRQHITSAASLSEANGPMLGRLFGVAAQLARDEGIARSGFRMTTNAGAGAGQSVPHLHFHLMGGRQMGWPPGEPPTMTQAPDRSYRALARQPSLARVVVAMQLGRTAGSALPIVLVLYALTIYESPPLAGVLTFLIIFPGLVAAPVIGALLDRLGRLRLIRVDYVASTVGAALLAALAVAGEVPIGAMIGITFVLGVTQMFSDSGLRSLFPRLSPAHLWERVNAVDSTGYQIATILGPPLAATLFVIGGAAPAFAAFALLYAGAWLALRRAREPSGPAPEETRLVDATLEGLRYVWHNRTLRAVSLGVSTTSVCLGIAVILLPIVLIDRLHAPGWTVGVAFALSGVLGIVAAVALGRSNTLGRERSLITVAAAGVTLSALILLPTTSAPVAIALVCVFGCAAVFGFAGGVWDVSVFTVRQRRTEPRMMGRAFAISMALNSCGYPIGAALGGWLATQSVELSIFVAVAFGTFGTVLGWLLLPATEDSAESALA